MARTKVLITVKAYPTLAEKYDELVCTAGFKEDGKWIRIYPVPFRKMDYDKRFKKYQWIEIDLIKNFSDRRPESYKPKDYNKIKLGEIIGTDGGYWSSRKDIVLNEVYTDLNQLISEAKNNDIFTSLAVFKPKNILEFTIEKTSREWDKEKLARLKSKAEQIGLFANSQNPFEVVKKLPYKFSYIFEDENNRRSKMMIEDWEIGQLFWNTLKHHKGNEGKACKDVRKKYFDDFAKTKDLYLFLGTTYIFHMRKASNPFVIVGTFHPKPDKRLKLF
ncbi:MAG: hypothetical protein ISS16_08805 [Ignavibacteria bacterium]|nr:hypothetical protein [Ignavibacteria bacterium]